MRALHQVTTKPEECAVVIQERVHTYCDSIVDHKLLNPQPGDKLLVPVGASHCPAVMAGFDRSGNSVVRLSAYGAYYYGDDHTFSQEELTVLRQIIADTQFAMRGRMITKGAGPSGSDPEVFVRDSKGQIMPAFTFLPDKKNPLVCPHDTARFQNAGEAAAFWDGYQAEFSIRANSCHAFMVDAIRIGLRLVLEEARKIDPKATLDWSPYIDLDPDLMRAQKPSYNELGCTPSLSAYGHQPIFVPNPETLRGRFAGCHMHFGWTMDRHNVKRPGTAERVVKAIDRIFGIISTSLLQDLDDPRRRVYYGKAGEYRLPEHGLEYRTPSSAIMCHPAITHLCFDLARCVGFDALGMGMIGRMWSDSGSEQETQEIINFCNVSEARKILDKNKEAIEAILSKIYPSNAGFAAKLIYVGARNVMPLAVEDVENNWCFGDPKWTTHSNAPNACVTACLKPEEFKPTPAKVEPPPAPVVEEVLEQTPLMQEVTQDGVVKLKKPVKKRIRKLLKKPRIKGLKKKS